MICAAVALIALPVSAADNPMWKAGLVWSCHFSSVLQCERLTDCVSKNEAGNVKLDYQENRVIDHMGAARQIKRHYTQSVAGSPISKEVKVELDSNDVLWLSPADAAGTFSDNWIGAMLSPKAGVVVQELRPLICRPQR